MIRNNGDQEKATKVYLERRPVKKAKFIKGTIIKHEYKLKVPKKDYAFYTSPNDNELKRIIAQFSPDLNDRFIFSDTDKPQRVIFDNEEEYSESEESHFRAFFKYCIKTQNKAFKHYEKSHFMRILSACNYNIEEAVQELNFDHYWRLNTLPIFLTDSMKSLLQTEFYYSHGRDRSLRPILILTPAVVLNSECEWDDFIMLSHFINQYVIDFMLTPGKIENWIGIINLENVSLFTFPKHYITRFLKDFFHHYHVRLRMLYVLNANFGIRCMWNVFNEFIDKSSKKNILIEGSNTHHSLCENIHPKQLQTKFGGEAENISTFWPPYSPSNEYGIDILKLNNDAILSDVISSAGGQTNSFQESDCADQDSDSSNSPQNLWIKVNRKKLFFKPNNSYFVFPNESRIYKLNKAPQKECWDECCCLIF